MLHEMIAAEAETTVASGSRERRRDPRAPLPLEVVLAWHHDMPTALRYSVSDVSDGGLRIISSTPLLEGMTGTAIRLLPTGKALDMPLMVVWIRATASGRYEIGLRRL